MGAEGNTNTGSPFFILVQPVQFAPFCTLCTVQFVQGYFLVFKMKIVIPYRDFKGPELKYCLRGIEKFIEQPEVTIIGDKPAWINNVTHIPFKDDPQSQFRSKNIYDKIMLVDHDFIFFNDDHFLLKPFSIDTYHYSGTLFTEILRPQMDNGYRKTIQNTRRLFGDLKNFDTHCPIFYKREVLEKINVDWSKPCGYCIKSVYAHLAGIEGTPYPDLKIRTKLSETQIKDLIKDREYFSTADCAINDSMIKMLDNLYPQKSVYEQPA